VEWPAKRSYVGLVAVGVQEQIEDILVPPLLRNCVTFNITFPFPSHYLPPQNSGFCNSFYCLGHSKMSMMMMMMMMRCAEIQPLSQQAAAASLNMSSM